MTRRLDRRLAFLLAAWLAVLGAGCGDRSGPPDPPPAPTGPPAPAEQGTERIANAAQDEAVTVRVVDETEFAEVVGQYEGKVVLVDVWATWCQRCLELFPHTVELSRQGADRGLVVISLSLDDPDDEPRVLDSLRAQGAAFDNFISRHGGSDKSLGAFQLKDGVLPIYRFYDRSGALRKTLYSSEAPIGADNVDRAVEELLDESVEESPDAS